MKKLITHILGISFLQALVAGLIIWSWSLVMINAEDWMTLGPESSHMAPMLIMPMIFIITATLSGGAVLGYPLYLAFQKSWAKAVVLVLLTLFWLGILSTVLIYIF